jgi:hypothetical protein
MATSKSTEKKSLEESDFDISSISGILRTLTSAFKITREPITPLPPPLILSGAKIRPGLSATEIASRIIARQSEANAPVGDIFAESNNIAEAMEVIRIQEIINAFLTEAKIEIVIPPGVSVTTTGVGNMGAPVLSQGATTNIAFGEGVIR